MGSKGTVRMSKDQSLQTQLKEALERGDKDAAMALMRQGGIGGLVQTLRAVQAAAADQAKQVAVHSGVQVSAAVKNAVQQGNPIDAIKRLREANPELSLKAAKDHVDALSGTRPQAQAQRTGTTFGTQRDRVPTVMMGDKPGGLRWLFVLIAFAALVWWWSTT